jgi:hypothetical protein
MKKNKKIGKLDGGYYHEALDRAYIVANQIEDLLIEHSVFIKHKNLKKRVKKAQQLILEAYQIIGGLECKLFPDKKKKQKD